MRYRGILFAFFCVLPCAQAAELPRAVSLVSLLATPSQFDGADVIVTGYLCRAGTDQLGLFLTRADCDEANYSNAIGVTEPSKQLPELPALLTVEGRFEDRTDRVFVDEEFIWGEIHATNVSGQTLR